MNNKKKEKNHSEIQKVLYQKEREEIMSCPKIGLHKKV